MRPDCQLRAFNAEVIGSPTMVLSPCSHSSPPTLVPLFGDDGEGCGGWRTTLSPQGTSSPRTWCSSAISPSSFGPSLVILGHVPPQLGPWAYYSKWAGVPRSFGPTPFLYDHSISFPYKLSNEASLFSIPLFRSIPLRKLFVFFIQKQYHVYWAVVRLLIV